MTLNELDTLTIALVPVSVLSTLLCIASIVRFTEFGS